MREIFFQRRKKNLRINDNNQWYHISEPDDLKNINNNLKT